MCISFEPENKSKFLNELNSFYARYCTQNLRREQNDLIFILLAKQHPEITFTEEDVAKALKKITARKPVVIIAFAVSYSNHAKQLAPI